MQSHFRQSSESCEVAVIGAGVAGLSCAARLQQLGHRCIVLEAEPQIGGRLRTVDLGQHHADAGAGWLHGLNGNPLLADGVLAVEDIIPCTASNIWTAGPAAADSTNFEPSVSDMERWSNRLAHIAALEAQECAPAGDAMITAIKSGTGEPWTTSDQRLLSGFELWFGAPVDQLCAGDWVPGKSMGDFEGPHAIVREGMPLVAQRLFERADGNSSVFVNCKLTHLEEDGEGITVLCNLDGESHSVRVQYVVCTVSLGALQQSLFGITPALPAPLHNAIQTLQMSRYCKCILLLSPELAGTMPVWTYTDHPLFPMAFSYFPLNGSPVVACTSISQELITMTDTETIAAAVTALGIVETAVEAFHVTRWDCDRSGGAYSYSPAGSDFTEVDEFLAFKLDRRIFFAGEHTHDEYQGSVHGAYLSGRQAAESVATRAGGGS